jgi:hypothetical protein
MKAMLYLDKPDEPVAILDEVKIVEMKQENHKEDSRFRIFFKASRLNATKKMVELHRDRKMVVKLDDGRSSNVLLLHSSMDMQGNAVGVLRVLGAL